jgi:hypothetical protein
MNDAEYEQNERKRLNAQIALVETAPLSERRIVRAEWFEALTDVKLIRERINWLLAGNYGKGAYDAAWSIKNAKRGNRIAAIAQLLAAVEWQCPANFAREAWNGLNKAAQKAINAAILDEMDKYQIEN